MIVWLIWAIIPLVLFGMIGISESFAEERTWYVGEGLKQGDYFSYKLCHADYQECKEFRMDFWIEDTITVGSEERWLAQTVVYDDSKIIKGTMELGKVASEPTGGSIEFFPYRAAFKTSVAELAVITSKLQPGSLTLDDYFFKENKWIPMGQIPIIFSSVKHETITIPAGIFDSTVIIRQASQDKFWVVDDFPFPIKAETWEPVEEPMQKRYHFELFNYVENVIEDPFQPIVAYDDKQVQESFAEVTGKSLPPKKQTKMGISPENVICNQGLELIFISTLMVGA